MNETILLRKNNVNYFVLAKWDLQEEKLNVLFEKAEKTNIMKSIDFVIILNLKYTLNQALYFYLAYYR